MAMGRYSRSIKAGARTPATREPRHRRTQALARSTKAGARTPATPVEPLAFQSILSAPKPRVTSLPLGA